MHCACYISTDTDALNTKILNHRIQSINFIFVSGNKGNTAELWYVAFDDMTTWNQNDMNESIIFSAFKPPELPPYNVLKRNSWPDLAFSRDTNGKVKLYALSMEMAQILQAVFHAQIR